MRRRCVNNQDRNERLEKLGYRVDDACGSVNVYACTFTVRDLYKMRHANAYQPTLMHKQTNRSLH